MTQKATELAKNLTKATDIDINGLYIDIKRIDNDIITATYRYRNEKKQTASLHDLIYNQKSQSKGGKLTGEASGILASSNMDASKGPCRNTYVIEYSVVNTPGGGWGRLLYYIIMHYAAEHGITPDRVKSSSSAVGTWNKLWADSEVEKLPLDDFFDPQTADPIDDCNLASSGVYGEKEPTSSDPKQAERYKQSKYAHDWNRMLRGDKKGVGDSVFDENEQPSSPEEMASRAEKYKKEKASKLNYVYVADSREAIKILIDAGMIAFDGKFPPKLSVTNLPVQKTPVPKTIQPIRESHLSIYYLLFGVQSCKDF